MPGKGNGCRSPKRTVRSTDAERPPGAVRTGSGPGARRRGLARPGRRAARAGRFPLVRPPGPYLVIAALGFGIAVHQVLTNWEALSGGRMGLPVPQVTFGPAGLTAEQRLYHLAGGGAVLLTWVA